MKVWITFFLLHGAVFLFAQKATQDEFMENILTQADSLKNQNPAHSIRLYKSALKLCQQKRCDQEAYLYNQLGAVFSTMGTYDSSIFYNRLALNKAKTLGNDEESLEAFQSLAENFRVQVQSDSVIHYLNRALQLAQQINHDAEEAGIYNSLGNIYLQLNNLEEALAFYIKSAQYYENKAKDIKGLSKALTNIGNVQYLLGNYDKALAYVAQGRKHSQPYNDYSTTAYLHKLTGRIYRKLAKTDSALLEYQQALNIYLRENQKTDAGEVYVNMGNIYYDQKKYKAALHYHKQGLDLARSMTHWTQVAYAYSSIGFSYYALKDWSNAKTYFDSSRLTATRVNQPYLVQDAYELISMIDEAQGNYKSALQNRLMYSKIKDSLSMSENRLLIEEMEAKYQNEKKTAEIELLKKDQQLQATAFQRQRAIQFGILIAMLAVVIISVLLVNRYRIINQTKRQIEIERVRNQIARDLHDDIGSTLSSINIVSQLALHDKAVNGSSDHFRQIHEHSSRIMENMSDIVWSIHPDNDSVEKLAAKMKEFTAEILEPKDIAYTFSGEDIIREFSMDLSLRKNIFLIYKEIINNAAKYSCATKLNINLLRKEKSLLLEVFDDGIGFDPKSVKPGNGLKNMKARTEELNGSFQLEAMPGKGTHITVCIPVA